MRQFLDIVTKFLTESTEAVTEAPISDITHLGDWSKSSSFRHEQDRKLLQNPKAIQKIKSLWRYPEEVTTNILLINNAEASRHHEVGIVDRAWIERNFPKTAAQILPLLKEDEVNIIFTNNKGDERVPMTAWVMAHRFGHVLSRPQSSYYFEEATTTLLRYLKEIKAQYGVRDPTGSFPGQSLNTNFIKNLMQAICTFRSAREKNLRNGYEAVHELFAQYITTGKMDFNQLPRTVRDSRATAYYRGDKDDYEHDNRMIQEDLPYELQSLFETAIHHAVGKIYVM